MLIRELRIVLLVLFLGAPLLTLGQQAAPVGSPMATTTLDGKQMPPPDPKFGGVIKEKASESKAWWAPRVVRRRARPTCC